MRRRPAPLVPYREGMEPTASTADDPEHDKVDGDVLFGIVLILLGFAVLADQADWVHWSFWLNFWPFIVLAFGLARLVAPGYHHGHRRPRRSALFLLTIGIWGAVSEYRLFGLHFGTSWPLLVVAAGLNMVLKSFDSSCAPRRVRES